MRFVAWAWDEKQAFPHLSCMRLGENDFPVGVYGVANEKHPVGEFVGLFARHVAFGDASVGATHIG